MQIYIDKACPLIPCTSYVRVTQLLCFPFLKNAVTDSDILYWHLEEKKGDIKEWAIQRVNNLILNSKHFKKPSMRSSKCSIKSLKCIR